MVQVNFGKRSNVSGSLQSSQLRSYVTQTKHEPFFIAAVSGFAG